MTGSPGDHTRPDESAEPDETAEARRRRRDRVFGAVLADTTADEQTPDDQPGDGTREDWLRRNVPPHHG